VGWGGIFGPFQDLGCETPPSQYHTKEIHSFVVQGFQTVFKGPKSSIDQRESEKTC
jgi:hypothetical protein